MQNIGNTEGRMGRLAERRGQRRRGGWGRIDIIMCCLVVDGFRFLTKMGLGEK